MSDIEKFHEIARRLDVPVGWLLRVLGYTKPEDQNDWIRTLINDDRFSDSEKVAIIKLALKN